MADETDDAPDVQSEIEKERVKWEAEKEKELAGIKANRDQALKEKRAAEKRYKGLEDVDPDEYKRLVAEAKEREQKDAEKAGNWEKLRESLLADHEKKMVKERARADKLHKALEDQLCKRAALEAMAKHGAATKLLLPHVLESVRMVETDDGEYTAQVFNPADGTARVEAGDLMTIDQLVESMKGQDEYIYAFPGTGSSGTSGDRTDVVRSGGANTVSIDDKDGFIKNIDKIVTGEVKVVS